MHILLLLSTVVTQTDGSKVLINLLYSPVTNFSLLRAVSDTFRPTLAVLLFAMLTVH